MIRIAQGEWIADLGAMLCRNINNGIVICFEWQGKAITGKIKDMPIELFEQWAIVRKGHKFMQKAVMEAEEVFLRAFYESDIEENGIKIRPPLL